MKVLVVAGEASADLHAGLVLERLAQKHPLKLFGIGGDQLEALGLKPIAHARDMGVVGLTEAISRIPVSLRLMRELSIIAEKEQPDLALLVDLPDFNLRLAPSLKALGIPVIYYVSPQVWAWRSGRVRQMAKVLDRLLCILPFEKDWYAKHAPGFKVDYVGHPAIEEIPDQPYEPKQNFIALLPGSRMRELRSLFPVMIEAAAILSDWRPDLEFHLPLAPTLRGVEEIERLLSKDGPAGAAIEKLGSRFRVHFCPAHEILRESRLAIVASGTATLETAVVGTPMVVTYQVSKLSAWIFKNLVKYRGPIAMANIVHVGIESSERPIPELLQDEVRADRVAAAAKSLLEDQKSWEAQKKLLARTRSILSGTSSPLDNVVRCLEEYAK